MAKKLEKATFAGGCFWCTETIFKKIVGVKKVTSGYSGGKMKNPTEEMIHSGVSGHAESVQVDFDPKAISFYELLYIFFSSHDPTTLNRQGVDVGTQYRSIVFYNDKKQKEDAIKAKKEAQKLYDSPIVTEIVPYDNFYEAKGNHQEYYEKK